MDRTREIIWLGLRGVGRIYLTVAMFVLLWVIGIIIIIPVFGVTSWFIATNFSFGHNLKPFFAVMAGLVYLLNCYYAALQVGRRDWALYPSWVFFLGGQLVCLLSMRSDDGRVEGSLTIMAIFAVNSLVCFLGADRGQQKLHAEEVQENERKHTKLQKDIARIRRMKEKRARKSGSVGGK